MHSQRNLTPTRLGERLKNSVTVVEAVQSVSSSSPNPLSPHLMRPKVKRKMGVHNDWNPLVLLALVKKRRTDYSMRAAPPQC